MKEELAWVKDALASKEGAGGSVYYMVAQGTIQATDGVMIAACPWKYGGDFLVPGDEFDKLVNRLPGEIKVSEGDGCIKLKAGRFSGTIQTLPIEEWLMPPAQEMEWRLFPAEARQILADLRPFVSDSSADLWANCIAFDDGWAMATNKIVLAGIKHKALDGVAALLPRWAIDFVLARDGITGWAWAHNYAAFRWANGSWMRTQLIVGGFPKNATALVHEAKGEKPSQQITDDFREAIQQVADLADDTVAIYADRVEALFGKANISVKLPSEVPDGASCSLWGAKALLPVMQIADAWSPGASPKPSVFKGKTISGYIVGRKA